MEFTQLDDLCELYLLGGLFLKGDFGPLSFSVMGEQAFCSELKKGVFHSYADAVTDGDGPAEDGLYHL